MRMMVPKKSLAITSFSFTKIYAATGAVFKQPHKSKNMATWLPWLVKSTLHQ